MTATTKANRGGRRPMTATLTTAGGKQITVNATAKARRAWACAQVDYIMNDATMDELNTRCAKILGVTITEARALNNEFMR